MFTFKKFWHYWWGTIVRPVQTLRQLASEHSLFYAFAAYFLFGLLYGLVALVGGFSGHAAARVLLNFISIIISYAFLGGLLIR